MLCFEYSPHSRFAGAFPALVPGPPPYRRMPSSRGGGGGAMPNFRQNLISRVAVADDSGKLEQILTGHSDIDLSQLKQFCWRYTLPEKRRYEVWKLLLGISSGFPEIRETVEDHRKVEADALWRSLQTMRLAEDKETSSPMPSDIVKMILLANGDLRDDVDFRSVEVAPIVMIVHHMRFVAGFERWRDAFALSRAAHRLFRDLFPLATIANIENEVRKQVDLDKADIAPSSKGVRIFMRSGGAMVFRSTAAVQKLWDKLFSGGESPPFLITQLLVCYVQLNAFRAVQQQMKKKNAADKQAPEEMQQAVKEQQPKRPKQDIVPGRLNEDDEMRLVLQATDAVLRKPNFKLPAMSSPSAVCSAAAVLPLLRGDPMRKSDGDRPPVPPSSPVHSPVHRHPSGPASFGHHPPPPVPPPLSDAASSTGSPHRQRHATSEREPRRPPAM